MHRHQARGFRAGRLSQESRPNKTLSTASDREVRCRGSHPRDGSITVHFSDSGAPHAERPQHRSRIKQSGPIVPTPPPLSTADIVFQQNNSTAGEPQEAATTVTITALAAAVKRPVRIPRPETMMPLGPRHVRRKSALPAEGPVFSIRPAETAPLPERGKSYLIEEA